MPPPSLSELLLHDTGRPVRATAILRVALAAVFIQAGAGKFVAHGAYVERFERWGFGLAPGAAAVAVGTAELVGGAALLANLAPRAAALGLGGVMALALVTAGPVDGGRAVWLPILLMGGLGLIVAAGGGRLRAPGQRRGVAPRAAALSPPGGARGRRRRP